MDTPGPALVNFRVTLSPPTNGTAYDAAATITLPAGLRVVNGVSETSAASTDAPVCYYSVGASPTTVACGTALQLDHWCGGPHRSARGRGPHIVHYR